jgi:hypothetical protein
VSENIELGESLGCALIVFCILQFRENPPDFKGNAGDGSWDYRLRLDAGRVANGQRGGGASNRLRTGVRGVMIE